MYIIVAHFLHHQCLIKQCICFFSSQNPQHLHQQKRKTFLLQKAKAHFVATVDSLVGFLINVKDVGDLSIMEK